MAARNRDRRAPWYFLAALLFLVVATGVGLRITDDNSEAHGRLARQACELAESNRAQMYRVLIYLSELESVPLRTREGLRSQASATIRQWTCEEILGIPPMHEPVNE